MTRAEKFADLRRTLVDGLVTIENEGRDMRAAAAELIKAGVVLSIASGGPIDTIEGLLMQFSQIANQFPAEYREVAARLTFPAVKGNA